MFKNLFRAAALALAGAVISMPATAATIDIVGGDTRVRVTDLPTVLSVFDSVAPAGENADLVVNPNGFPVFVFGISGGQVGPDNTVIEHAGTGVRLGLGGSFAEINNFQIDVGAGVINAQVGGTGPFAPVFDLTARRNGSFYVDFSETLANTLATAFGTPALAELAGFRLGTARAEPQLAPIPLPAAGWMLLAGVGGLVALRRRARSVAA